MTKLKLNWEFEPCPTDEGDELFGNGIFQFNITRLLVFIAARPEQFPLEKLDVRDIPDYGGANLSEETIRTAVLTRPILQVELAPHQYVVIDGHHRIARARRDAVHTLPAYRVPCPQHVPFLICERSYTTYVEYWNSKFDDGKRSNARNKNRF